MGPGASKLKHLPVKQQDKDTDDRRAQVCRKTRYWACKWHNLRRSEKTQTGKLYKGELFVLDGSSPYQSTRCCLLCAGGALLPLPRLCKLVRPEHGSSVVLENVIYSNLAYPGGDYWEPRQGWRGVE